ncbi:MAG: Gldg family protein [Verrucomicrobiales bacterium]
MAEEETSPAPSPTPAKRGGNPLWHAVAQLSLAAAVFIMLNALSCQRFARHDATRAHVSNLSETTTKVLGVIEERTRIVVAFVNDSPLKEKTWHLAKAYADARPGLVQARLLDPVRDPENAREYSKKYNVTFKDDAVIILSNGRAEVIPSTSLELIKPTPDGKPRPVAYAGEDAITAALLRLLDPNPPLVYLITGKGPWPDTTMGNGSDTLRAMLPRYHARVKELSLDGLEAIPKDAAAVLLANPKYDLSGKEIRLLREFWDQRKGGIAVMLNPDATLPNLEAFLKYHGLEVDRRVLMKATTGAAGPSRELSVSVRFLPGSALTDPFINADAKFPGTSVSLKVDTGREDLRNRGIRPFSLAESAPGYWGESRPAETPSVFDQADDAPGPLVVAAAVERSPLGEAGVRLSASRMVVMANPHLLDPDALTQSNSDFFFSSINWLLDRQAMIGIGPRQPVLFQVNLTDRQSRMLNVVLLIGLPAIALILAWLVAQRRRS